MRTGRFFSIVLASAGLLPLQAAIKVVPKPGVAILVNEWNSHTTIGELDGVEVRGRGTYELAPGNHTVKVWLYYTEARVEVSCRNPVDYTFEAQAGTVIQMVCEEHVISRLESTWRVWFKDQASGRIVPSRQGRSPASQTQPGTDPSALFEAALKKAEAGDLEAEYEVGLLYVQGCGVAADPAKAALWYRKAAERGHAMAAYLLGLACDQGDGLLQDHAEAYVWLSVAAERGHSDAPYFRDGAAKLLSPEVLARADARRVVLLKGMPQTQPTAP